MNYSLVIFLAFIVLAAAVINLSPRHSAKNFLHAHFQSARIFTGYATPEEDDTPTATVYAVDINKQKFMLYTTYNKDTPYELKNDDATNLKKSLFDPTVPTKFVIHGWENNFRSESVQLVKDAYLRSKKVNVICCDFEVYNSPYFTAVSQAENVGANIGIVISFLIKKGGLKAQDIHIIGHSLGAHIAGFAAQSVLPTTKIPRITGLDPAGPMFEHNAAAERLSNDDAQYVDCIHTSTAFGMSNRCGTVDFYPNGGNNQPICADATIPEGCDHASSARYFARSITHKNAFPALTCQSVAEARALETAVGTCVNKGAVMGEEAINRTPPGVYFVAV